MKSHAKLERKSKNGHHKATKCNKKPKRTLWLKRPKEVIKDQKDQQRAKRLQIGNQLKLAWVARVHDPVAI